MDDDYSVSSIGSGTSSVAGYDDSVLPPSADQCDKFNQQIDENSQQCTQQPAQPQAQTDQSQYAALSADAALGSQTQTLQKSQSNTTPAQQTGTAASVTALAQAQPEKGTTFSDVSALYGYPDVNETQRRELLDKGVTAARDRRDQLDQDAQNNPNGPIAQLRDRYAQQAGIPADKLEKDPFYGVSKDQIEQAYRSWAEQGGQGTPPWERLAVAVKEGWVTTNAQPSTQQMTQTPEDARALWRSQFYFQNMGLDHFLDHQPQATGDNSPIFDASSAPAHQAAFETNADAIKPGIAAQIDNELKVTPNASGGFDVKPTSRFYELSLQLTDGYFRENTAKVEGQDSGLGYIRWNMGDARYQQFEASAINHAQEPQNIKADGTAPTQADWAFKTPIKDHEYDQPRRNALRFQYFSDVFRLAYQGGY